MSRERAQALLPVVKALAEGKPAECRYAPSAAISGLAGALPASDWVNAESYLSYLGHPRWEFRVKPEAAQYRRYLRESDGKVRCATLNRGERTAGGGGEVTVERIVGLPGFIRWVDEDWITEEV